MSEPTDNLDIISKQVRENLTAKDKAREKMLPMCREAIRCCSEAIRAIHRQEFEKAEGLLESAHKLLTESEEALAGSPELVNTGSLRDAQKEYVEGCAVLNIVTGKLLPTAEELAVDSAAYLNGLGEAASELRRYLLDSMRKGDISKGEKLLTAMDDIYSVLVTIDFPDAITGGLRRTTDMLRGVLERTRSDLTLLITQQDLGQRIEKLEKKLEIIEEDR
ncbi:MAG: haloacid dehalogenase [Dehalococcoidales bacterium]|nr:MAG: haloacid dehalogenase [Dehalococcoidales bacterium]